MPPGAQGVPVPCLGLVACCRHSSHPGSSEGHMLLSPPSRCVLRPVHEELYPLRLDACIDSPRCQGRPTCLHRRVVPLQRPLDGPCCQGGAQEAPENSQAARRLRWRATDRLGGYRQKTRPFGAVLNFLFLTACTSFSCC